MVNLVLAGLKRVEALTASTAWLIRTAARRVSGLRRGGCSHQARTAVGVSACAPAKVAVTV